MVKVSEALFERIRQRVEHLIQRKLGTGGQLTDEERGVIKGELKVLIANAPTVTDKDLARIAVKVSHWKAQHPGGAASGSGGNRGGNVSAVAPSLREGASRADASSAVESSLPPVSVTPRSVGLVAQQQQQLEHSSGPLLRQHGDGDSGNGQSRRRRSSRGTEETPSRSSASVVSSSIVPRPPGRPQKSRTQCIWANGISEDVERYRKEQREVSHRMRENAERHRQELARQVSERRTLQELEKTNDLRFVETQRATNEQREEEHQRALEDRRAKHAREKEDRYSELQKRQAQKEREAAKAREENDLVSKEIRRALEDEKEHIARQAEAARMQRDHDRAEFMHNLEVLDKKEHERLRQVEKRRRDFERHQHAVDGMAGLISQKGSTRWVDLGDVDSERRDQERVKRLMEEEVHREAERRLKQATSNKADLDRQMAERERLMGDEREKEAAIHGQLMRHLQMVEDKERMRRAEQRRLEAEHKQQLDVQVQNRRIERSTLEIGV